MIMEAKTTMPTTMPPFQKIKDAVRTTGLSEWYFRHAIADGTCPYIRSGRVLYVNVPALLRQLGADPGGELNERV